MRASLFRTPGSVAAPRGRRPQVPELRIRVEYDLSAYYPGGAPGDGGARYTFASDSPSAGSGGTAEHPAGAVHGDATSGDALGLAASRVTR